ncbi:MAG: hypothetical protein NTX49_06490 [Chlamydiae bacterium]|nr:hypothetical protein [Chlamydiota bacterium]
MKLLSSWSSVMGFQFENLVLSNRKIIHEVLGIDVSEIVNDNPFFQRKTKNKSGCQIDYFIQTKFGTCYLCEVKFSSKEVTESVIDEVKQKITSLSLPKNLSIRPVLIHVCGVDEKVIESDFFSSIIDFNVLLNRR